VRVWVLGSGSRGNAVLLECGDTRLLVDAGFAPRELAQRLASIGVAPQSIEACVVTHEHTDHGKGAATAAKRWGWALYATPGTAAACPALLEADARTVEAGSTFAVGRFDVRTVPTPHDAAESIAVVATARPTGARAAVCYDLGAATDPVRQALREVDVLVLESNHDEGMLWSGPYPPSVCNRIAGRHGHLSNVAAGRLARESVHRTMSHVVLAHLSENCNDHGVAVRGMTAALARTSFRGRIDAALQHAAVGPFSPIPSRCVPVAEQLGLGF
jgi:phosphoribosyl 1,2-cyclic phosphodiesterase